MADVFANSSGETTALSSPMLSGAFLPNLDGALQIQTNGYRVPWGGASLLNRLSYDAGVYGGSTPAAQMSTGDLGNVLAELMAPIASFMSGASELLVGPMGPPGIQGAPGAYVVGGIGALGFAGETGAAGEDAFANIDLPIAYDGFEGAFANNSPSAGYVAWTAFKIKYQGVEYQVAANATGTSNAFIYWNQNSTPTSLLSTNTLTTAAGDEKWIVCVNSSGTAYPAQFVKALNAGVITAGSIIADHISANAITTVKINDQNVTTGKVADNAITAFDSDTSASGSWTSGNPVVAATVADFVLADGYMDIRAEVELDIASWYGGTVDVILKRDSTTLRTVTLAMSDDTRTLATIAYLDAPGDGTYDYSLTVSSADTGGDYYNATVFATNVKK